MPHDKKALKNRITVILADNLSIEELQVVLETYDHQDLFDVAADAQDLAATRKTDPALIQRRLATI